MNILKLFIIPRVLWQWNSCGGKIAFYPSWVARTHCEIRSTNSCSCLWKQKWGPSMEWDKRERCGLEIIGEWSRIDHCKLCLVQQNLPIFDEGAGRRGGGRFSVDAHPGTFWSLYEMDYDSVTDWGWEAITSSRDLVQPRGASLVIASELLLFLTRSELLPNSTAAERLVRRVSNGFSGKLLAPHGGLRRRPWTKSLHAGVAHPSCSEDQKELTSPCWRWRSLVSDRRSVDRRERCSDLGLVTLLASNEQGPPGENVALTPVSSYERPTDNGRTF